MLLSSAKVFALLTVVSITMRAHPISSAIQNAPRKSIRSVDFGNFSYPRTKGLHKPHSRNFPFTLKDGSLPETRDKEGFVDEMGVSLSKIIYGDVTSDGQEEAIVVLSFLTGGSAMHGCVYVYGWSRQRPTLLWAFDTGDRADGGLRRVWAENGYLMVELNGNGRLIDRNLYAEDKTNRGACCPTRFTRARYKWTGNGFRLAGKPKVLHDLLSYQPPQSRTD
jgi:hypothetical protein